MKLISLNVGLFEANNDKLAAFLGSQQADIVCLQEVTKSLESATNPDFISKEVIDKATPSLKESFFAPIWVLSKFEKQNFHGKELFKFDLGGKTEFGNYIRTNKHIANGQNIFVQNHFSYVTDWSNWPNEDYRAVQVVDILIDNTPLRLLNYHGIWSKDKRGTEKTRLACERIKQLALEKSYPSIICGDFNLFPDTESMAVFKTDFMNLANEFNIRTTRPDNNELSSSDRNVVDYILMSKTLKVTAFEVADVNVSDHLPLILDFDY